MPEAGRPRRTHRILDPPKGQCPVNALDGRLGVMHVVLSLRPGGTERLVVEMARRAGPSVRASICCLDERGAWADEAERDGVPVTVLGRRPGFRPGLGFRLAAAARAHRARVLHCHQYTPFVYGVLAKCTNPGLRIVFTEHGRLADSPPSPRRRVANAFFGRAAGHFFAVSDELRRFLEREGFPAGRLRVLPNGIDIGPRPAPGSREDARRRLGIGTEAPLVGTAARLDPVKGLETLVAAFDRLRGARPDARLLVLGDGPERSALEADIARRGLGAAVTLAGHRGDVRDLLPALDLYVNSSTYEGVSLTILEAMAAEVAVVATAVGGTPEVVADGETGRLVPPRDADALFLAIDTLLGDAALRARLAGAGRRRAEERFDFERMMSMYRQAYGVK